jgi:hypothetical protein
MGSQVAKLVPRNLTRFHRQGFVASQKLQHWFQQLWGKTGNLQGCSTYWVSDQQGHRSIIAMDDVACNTALFFLQMPTIQLDGILVDLRNFRKVQRVPEYTFSIKVHGHQGYLLRKCCLITMCPNY